VCVRMKIPPADDPLIPKRHEGTLDGYSFLGREDPFQPVRRPIIFKKESFIRQFVATRGPPQIFSVVVMLTMSFGATVGIVPSIMIERFARLKYGYDGDDCNSYESYSEKPEACLLGSDDAQNAAAVSELIANTLTLITSSMIGSFSDMHGRRGMLLLGICLATLPPFSLIYVEASPMASPWVYFAARALHGLVNWMAIALSALADVLPPQLRAPGVGLLMAGSWFGVCIGPTLASFMDHSHAIALSCVIQIVGLLSAFIFFPETLPPHAAEEARRRREPAIADRSLLGRLFSNLARPVRELSIINRSGFFRLLSCLAFFNGMVTAGDRTLILYYVDSKLSFTTKDVAIMFLLVGAGAVIAQGVILKPLNDCIGERKIVIGCFCFAVVSNTIYGLAQNRATLYAGVCLASLTGMAFPIISAIKANNVVRYRTCLESSRSLFSHYFCLTG
jgi:DHA1 family tetracycline resistance protein-like MFS transporter